MLLRHNRHLSTVQKLEQQKEHLIPHGVHGYDIDGPRRRSSTPRRGGGCWVEARRWMWVGPTEEFAEEETPRCQDAAVGVDETTFDLESDVAEGLAVDEEVQVVKG